MSPSRTRSPHSLTPYQRQVLLLLAQGLTTKEIALRLKRRPCSIQRRIAEIKRRLQAETRAQAVARAAARGLLAGDGQ